MINLYKYLNEIHVALQVHAKIAQKKQQQKNSKRVTNTVYTINNIE